MKLELEIVGRAFVGMTSLVVRARVTSDVLIEISEGAAIDTALLRSIDNPNVDFGFSRSVLRAPHGVVGIGPSSPLVLEADILQQEEDLDGLVQGGYEVAVGLFMFLRTKDGDYSPIELREVVKIEVEPAA